ncbi:MAG: hypothetical protein EOP56_13025 [Sphingobacteriales bacterium]|nr:MAG: hypothetical protein EOP56_13025 [Sphingobacteriales bacterium]
MNLRSALLIALFTAVTSFAFAQKSEQLKIDWPDEYKWQIGSDQETQEQHMIELVPGNETVEKWTILGTMISIKNVQNVPMNVATNLMFEQAKKRAIEPKITIIERNDDAKHPWIIFKIEAASFNDDPNPESQLYYIIQGNTSLYTNLVAIKEKALSKAFVDKWAKTFKKSELVYQ